MNMVMNGLIGAVPPEEGTSETRRLGADDFYMNQLHPSTENRVGATCSSDGACQVFFFLEVANQLP